MREERIFKTGNVQFITAQLIQLYPAVLDYEHPGKLGKTIHISYKLISPRTNTCKWGIELFLNGNYWGINFEALTNRESGIVYPMHKMTTLRKPNMATDQFIKGIGSRNLLDGIATYLLTSISDYISCGNLIHAATMKTVCHILQSHLDLLTKIVELSASGRYLITEDEVIDKEQRY